jgi:nicotinate dehydrogenase large molybdopterin subunit
MEKRMIRYDGIPKVTGSLDYLTDLTFPDTLYGKILRSPYPHARILSVHTEKAKQLPGVKAVLTYADVPAVNGYGIIVPDHPFFVKRMSVM